MIDHRTKLKNLLRELFQFDAADLDFGIYRIMNQRRAEIDDFIENGLLDAVAQEFTLLQEGVVEEKREELDRIALGLQKTYPGAIDDEGNLILPEQYLQAELPLAYKRVQEEIARATVSAEAEAEIFNALYTFFSRYYDRGDFVTKGRYSRTHKYAIPYNGEEVLLHWANRDQYYVKTADTLTDYAFVIASHGGYRVRFKLAVADTEHGNVKGDKRYFFPVTEDVAHYDVANRELTLFFEYRPLTGDESTTYGRARIQAKIIAAQRDRLLAAVPDATLRGLLATPAEGKEAPPLDLHLTRWTRKATSDFFIHKGLRAFLERELDFYLKNEVMRLDDLDTKNAARAERYLTRLVVIKRLARKVIAFLAQIEDFQKSLFEKPKFVLASEWCVTLDRLPEDLLPQVAANDAQWAEWQRLFGVQKPVGQDGILSYLTAHPTLTVDTALYDTAFKDALLAALSDGEGSLDAQRDGLLIHGENFQALTLLQAAYLGKVKCIYIDPPYNTGSGEFVYKDRYQHSSWLSMMADRLPFARDTLCSDGVIFVSCDFHEHSYLLQLMRLVFGARNLVATFHLKVRHEGRILTGDKEVQEVIEQVICSKMPGFDIAKIELAERPEDYRFRVVEHTDSPEVQVIDGKRVEIFQEGQYQIIKTTPATNLLKRISIRGTIRKGNSSGRFFVGHIENNYETGTLLKVEGIGDDGLGYRYFLVPEGLKNGLYFQGRPLTRVKREKPYPTFYDFVQEFNTVGYEGDVDFKNGKKPVAFIDQLFEISDLSPEGLVLDFFAGSGSTAHAVINLNRDDGGERKYILVEQGDYFDTVLKPRIQKVVYAAEWKNGRPVEGSEGSSHAFQYLRLESYEDTLDNLDLDTEAVPTGLFPPERDDYLLRYFLDHETRQGRLNVESFATPFDYQLRVRRQGIETRVGVDLLETANFLLGFTVQARRTYEHQGRTYRAVFGMAGDQSVVVIWRDTAGLDLPAEAAFIQAEILRPPGSAETSEVLEPDWLYVNGDSHVPHAQPIEAVFMNAMRDPVTSHWRGN